MAKKAKGGKRKTTSSRTTRSAPAKTVKAKASKSARKKPAQTKAARTKVAARAAASRTEKKPAPQPAMTTMANIARGVAGVAVAAVTKRLPWTKDDDDPIVMLETDHRRFKKLLADGEATTEHAKKSRREILAALTSGLNVHEALEEKLFYPSLEPHAEAHDLVLESSQEHHLADTVIKELHDVATDDEQWGAKFKVLKENVTHHISEEENKLFPIARGVLAREELAALGARMRALRGKLEK